MDKTIKRFLAFLLIPVVLWLAACGKTAADEPSTDAPVQESASAAPTEESTAGLTPEDKLAGINELEPNAKGVYQIKSIEGLRNIAKHPDAKFELVCSIDLEGATLEPIGSESAPFTGRLDGMFYTISNFTVERSDGGDLALFGCNEGTIRNLTLENVTVRADESAVNIGTLAGTNRGSIDYCNAAGQILVENAGAEVNCGGGFGRTTGSTKASSFAVDIAYQAAGKANVGGLAGSIQDAELKNCSASGTVSVSDGAKKSVGMLAGFSADTTLSSCSYYGESCNSGGENVALYCGTEENVTREKCSARDNSRPALDPKLQAVRDTVVEKMYEMGTVEWYVSEPLYHSCTCTLAACHGVFVPGIKHLGLPYNHKGGSLARFKSVLDETGTVQDWVYDLGSFDGYDLYMGNDCATAIAQAYATVSHSFTFTYANQMIPDRGYDTIPVGDYEWKLDKQYAYSKPYVEATGEQRMYEAYAQMRKGDSVAYTVAEGGHTRMCAEDPVVVRYEDGTIDPENSYVLMHQQGGVNVVIEPYYTTWGIFTKITFSHLYHTDTALPITIAELLDGDVAEPAAALEGGADGRDGLISGTVTSNYFLDSVTLCVTDADGKAVFDHTLFTTVGKYKDEYSTEPLRELITQYDMAHFATPLQGVYFEPGKTYHVTVTAHVSSGDDFVVREFDFT